MQTKTKRAIVFAFALVVIGLIVWWANSVFLLAFAGILLAILLNAIGKAAQKLFHLPYAIALIVALILIFGILTLIFWLYSPLIGSQFQLLVKQLPQAVDSVMEKLTPFFGKDFLSPSIIQEFFPSNEKIFTQVLSIFSTTLGSLIGFVIFIIIGLYLAFDPSRYVNWITMMTPKGKQKRTLEIMNKMGQSLRWWLLGKMLSMSVVGILTFVGLALLHVSLAFILGLLAALLTFIPYVGAILAAIPAVLIAFAQSPLTALYVILLYIGIHIIDGYYITPSIEQRTVSIPPALSILAQVLMTVLIGGIGLALATPLMVVMIALVQTAQRSSSSLHVAQQSHKSDDN